MMSETTDTVSSDDSAMVQEGLNAAQQAAVTHGDGPLLVIAGAGTGKTTVIAHRIAHLINSKRARPEQVLALTFTEKAAAEMERRVDLLVPYGFTDTWISTSRRARSARTSSSGAAIACCSSCSAKAAYPLGDMSSSLARLNSCSRARTCFIGLPSGRK